MNESRWTQWGYRAHGEETDDRRDHWFGLHVGDAEHQAKRRAGIYTEALALAGDTPGGYWCEAIRRTVTTSYGEAEVVR